MENVLKKVYIDILPIVIQGIEENFIEEIKQNYYKNLFTSYDYWKTKLNNMSYNDMYHSIYNLEMAKWKNIKPNAKKSMLLEDKIYNQILEILDKINLVLKNYNNYSNADNIIENCFTQIKQLLPNVYDFNIFIIRQYINECTEKWYNIKNPDNQIRILF